MIYVGVHSQFLSILVCIYVALFLKWPLDVKRFGNIKCHKSSLHCYGFHVFANISNGFRSVTVLQFTKKFTEWDSKLLCLITIPPRCNSRNLSYSQWRYCCINVEFTVWKMIAYVFNFLCVKKQYAGYFHIVILILPQIWYFKLEIVSYFKGVFDPFFVGHFNMCI